MEFSEWQLSDMPNELETQVTNQKLKELLKNSLDQSEALTGIKAQIRKQLLKKLVGTRNAEIQPDNVISNSVNSTMEQQMLRSAVFHYLKSNKYLNTLSVFSAEVDFDNSNHAFSEYDIARMLKFASMSKSFLTKMKQAEERKFTFLRNHNHVITPTEPNEAPISLLDHIFEYCLSLREELVKDSEVQVSIIGPSPREVLERDLEKVETEFSRQKELQLNNLNFEERMLLFQQELESRKNKEVDLQVAYFKEREIEKIRLEESAKSRHAIESLRRELEFDYQQRLQGHLEREAQLQRSASEQERRMQQTLYDHRQIMQRDLDDLRAREQATARRYELEAQGLKLLELRLKEAQQVLETRERECERLEREATLKMNKSLEIARKETADRLAVEQETFYAEKRKLTADKLKFDEEKVTLLAEVDAARAIRQDLHRLQEDLAGREGELTALKRLLGARRTVDGDDFSNNLSYRHQRQSEQREKDKEIQQLLQRNRELEAKAALQEDAQKVLQLLEAKNQELESTQLELARTQVDRERLSSELESMRQELHGEKNKSIAREHKVSELQQLVKEKTATIDSLMKQVEAISKKEKFTPSSHHPPPPAAPMSYNHPLPSYYPPSWTQPLPQLPPSQPQLYLQQYSGNPLQSLDAIIAAISRGYGPTQEQQVFQPVGMNQTSQPPAAEAIQSTPMLYPSVSQKSQYIPVQISPAVASQEQAPQPQVYAQSEQSARGTGFASVSSPQPLSTQPHQSLSCEEHLPTKTVPTTPKVSSADSTHGKISAEEVAKRAAAETEMLQRLEAESTARLKAEQQLQGQLKQEELRRQEAEKEMKRLQALQSAQEAEVERRLQQQLQAAAEAQAKAERDLQQRLQLESEAKAKEEHELQLRLAEEAQQRAAVERRLQEEQEREAEARLKAERDLEEVRQKERELIEQAEREQAEYERRVRLAAQRKAEEEKERQLELQLEAEQRERDRLLKEQETAEEKRRQAAALADNEAAAAEEAERKRKEEEDAASILEARAKVLARRKEKSIGSSINMSASIDASQELSSAAAPPSAAFTQPPKQATVQKPKMATRPSFDFLAVDSDSSAEKGLEVGDMQDEQDELSF